MPPAAQTVVGKVTGKLPSSSRAALALPPGGYILTSSITPEHGRSRAAVRRVIPLTLAAGQRRRAVRIAEPTAKSSATGSPRARSAYTQESGVQTDLTSAPCRSAEVANSSDRAIIEQELDFQRSRYVDPSTRVTRNFIKPDIVVRGRLQTRGDNLGYTLTLVDGRTGTILETISGTLAGSELFEAEQRLAARVARRLCAYGEVFEVTFTGTGTANFATHSATGTLSAERITAKPTEKDAQGPTRWEGSAPVSWTNVVVASKTDCSYADPVSGGTWTAKLARAGDGLEVQWLADSGAAGTATVVRPTGDGGEVRVPGQPTTALIGSMPDKFVLPANGMQQITGGLKDQGDGWDNTLELKVRTIRVEPLG